MIVTRLIAIALVLLLLGGATGCKEESYAKETSAYAPKHIGVSVASLGSPVEYSSAGSVVSDQRVDITSRLSGYIQWMQVHEGDAVRRGQVLVRLDAADIDGSIRQAGAGLKAAEAAFKDAEIDRAKFQNLYDRGSISENELRKITLKYDASRETLNQAKAVFGTAESQRRYTEITSPIDGIVIARSKLVGDMALPGVPILTIESGRNLMFETSVDASKRVPGLTTPNTPVVVQLEGLKDPLEGVVSRVVSSADPSSHSYQLKIALPNSKGLIPGLYGKAIFNLGTTDLLTVPKQALIERGGLLGVFVIENPNVARFRWVRTGKEWSDRVEIAAGLQAGEQFVSVPDSNMRDGDRVLIGTVVK